MNKNIIFVFTGTGNSLWSAKEIASEIGDCEIVSMGSNSQEVDLTNYESIGFVYPTYYRGIPHQVKEFISNLQIPNNDLYTFAIATCGKVSCGGNSIVQVQHLLKNKGVTLDYAKHLGMFSNYVVMYDMKDTVDEEARQSAINLETIKNDIKDKAVNKQRTINEPFQKIAYTTLMHFAPKMDKNFNVSDACTHCEVCKKVCSVNNISMDSNEKPQFNGQCEQCLACIHNCPMKAINYKDKTQDRSRYIHPSIGLQELIKLNDY